MYQKVFVYLQNNRFTDLKVTNQNIMNKQIQESGVNQFNAFLRNYTKEAQPKQLNENYYHYNVVLEAYCQGKEQGKEDVEQKIIDKCIDRFIDRANQVYQMAKTFTEMLAKNRYGVKKFYINVFHRNPKVIVVIEESLMLEDEFVYFVYPKLNEMKSSFFTLFENTLDISLIGHSDLSEYLLKSDGFGYTEDV